MTAYRRLLFWLSLAICAVSLAAAFLSAVRIYPAFGFFGVLSAEDKIGLMKKTAVYTVAGMVCLFFVAPEHKKLSRRTLILAAACALLPPFGIAVYSFQSAYTASYQIAALCFYIIPLTFTSALSDFIAADTGRKHGSCAVMAFFGALLLLICSLAAMYLVTGSVLLLPVILYTMLPFIIFTDIIVLLNRPSALLSRRTAAILFVNAAVMPACNIVLPYNTETAIFICGWMLVTGMIVSIISTVYDIWRLNGKYK